jgi:hypothetical protein
MKGGYVCSNCQPISVIMNDSNKQILNVMFNLNQNGMQSTTWTFQNDILSFGTCQNLTKYIK